MELVDLALRLCAARALRGSTYCGQKVFDSEILPIEGVLEREARPFISIYTDASRTEKPEGRDLMGSERHVDLTFEIAVCDAPSDGGDDPAPTLQRTDAAIEAQLNIITRQIHRALFASPGDWADLFKRFIRGFVRVEGFRGAMAGGQRFAARQIVMTLKVIAEPPYAAPATSGPWAALLTKMRSDPTLAELADILENEISATDLATWQVGVAELGVSLDQWTVLGQTNLGGAPYAPQEGDVEALDENLDLTILPPPDA